MGKIYLSAAWGALLIVLFGIAIGTDSNAPNPNSGELFTYIVHTDRGSMLSGMAGPIYTMTRTVAGNFPSIILEDTWGQGSAGYRFGFVLGSVLLLSGIGPIGALIAVVRSMMD